MQQQPQKLAKLIVSKISEFVEIGNFKAILKDIGVNAVSVEYILGSKGDFKGECRVTVKHEDKQQSLDHISKLNLIGQQLEVITEKKLQKRDPQAKIYVSGLDSKVTSDMFFKTFKHFGQIESCQLRMNPDGTSKGFGYVWYRERAHAAEAIKQLNGKQFAGKEIRVSIFVEKVQAQPPKPDNNQPNPPIKPAEEKKKEEVKGGLAGINPLKVPEFIPNTDPSPIIPEEVKGPRNIEFVVPNKALFKDNFWTQDVVNKFMNQNWGQNDPNYKDNLRVAQVVQDILIEKRDLLFRKTETIKNLQKTNDPRLSFLDYAEEKSLEQSIQLFQEKFDPFTIVNSNPELLNCQIDLHGGLRKSEASRKFLHHFDRIKAGLYNGTIATNSHLPKNHIVKVICGYGHHSVQTAPERIGQLRQAFNQLLISSRFDFVYIEKNGCFLVRIKLN